AVPGEMARWGFAIALEALGFAALALALTRRRDVVTALLRQAARDVSIAAAILAPVLAAYSGDAVSWWHTGTLYTLFVAGLVIARLTDHPLATYLGSAAALLGFLHLVPVMPPEEADSLHVVVALLAHATLTTLTAVGARHLERLFATPLRVTALIT